MKNIQNESFHKKIQQIGQQKNGCGQINTSSTEPVNGKVLRVQSMKLRQHEIKAERNGD